VWWSQYRNCTGYRMVQTWWMNSDTSWCNHFYLHSLHITWNTTGQHPVSLIRKQLWQEPTTYSSLWTIRPQTYPPTHATTLCGIKLTASFMKLIVSPKYQFDGSNGSVTFIYFYEELIYWLAKRHHWLITKFTVILINNSIK
jgi:hypothetical protein